MIKHRKEQIIKKINEIEKKFSEWKRLDYLDVSSFIESTGDEDEIIEYYELKAQLKTIEWILKLVIKKKNQKIKEKNNETLTRTYQRTKVIGQIEILDDLEEQIQGKSK